MQKKSDLLREIQIANRKNIPSLILIKKMKLATLILIIISSLRVNAQITIEEKEIDDGILHKKIINTQDTLIINILKIDLSSGNYIIESIKAKSLLNAKEKTSEMARAFNDSIHNVIAALNADFFEADGEIVNNMILKGTIVKAVKFTDSPFNSFVNTQFALTINNKLLMEQFVFSGNIILPDGNTEEIKRVNSISR
jgi:hypothetical protein